MNNCIPLTRVKLTSLQVYSPVPWLVILPFLFLIAGKGTLSLSRHKLWKKTEWEELCQQIISLDSRQRIKGQEVESCIKKWTPDPV